MRISVQALRAATVEILSALGESPSGAERVADCLVRADMRGITTHGTYLLKPIAERAKAGMLSLPTKPVVIRSDGATVVVDGQNGLGPVVGYFAMEICIQKAKDFGVGLVLVRNTNNVGFLGYYTQFAAEQGMIGMMASNAAPSMAPWGGAEPFIGTNPIAISIPTGQEWTFTADMAMSVVARGKIRKAAREKEKIPVGWALDQNGAPTTDPEEALKGTLLPIGGPKGSALALAVDIIAGLLAGARYGPGVKTFHELTGPTGVGVACLAIDIQRFLGLGEFEKLMRSYIQSVKGIRKATGFTEIILPGELEYRREQESLALGVELEEQTVAKLDDLLREVGAKMRLGGSGK